MGNSVLDGRKQVLVLTSTFPRWEGDNEPPFVFELSKRLGEQFKVMALCPHAPNAKLFETIAGIETHRFRYFLPQWQKLAYEGGILANLKKNRLNYLLVPFFLISELFNLVLILRKTRIDVIHAHWLIPQGLIALMACTLAPQKPTIVCTSHGGDLFGLSGGLMTWLKKQVIRRVTKLTVVSQTMRAYACSLFNRNDIEVIPMGVDLLQTFIPLPDARRSPFELLYVGRLVEKKGVRYIILAMPEILKRHPQAQLLVAGDGPDKADLQKLALATGVASHVQFLGTVNNAALPEFYQRATLFVAPSIVAHGGDQEGLGLVFVEALGCECPVVTTDLPAIKDVVSDGNTGLICKQKDSADLAQKILHLLAHPEQAQTLGRAGRQYVLEHFDWQIVSQRYHALIAALCYE